MRSSSPELAHDRARRHLLDSEGAEGLIARREAGSVRPGDVELRDARLDRLGRTQEADGSWGHSVLRTGETLLEVAALGLCDPDEAGGIIRRAAEWLRGRQNEPGRYGSRCTARRHELGTCEHFLGGFFAPGAGDAPAAGLSLRCGAAVPPGDPARLALSCIALESLLACGIDRTDVRLHLRGLVYILSLQDDWYDADLPAPAALIALRALLRGSRLVDADAAIRTALGRMAQHQRADGSWPDIDVFQAVDVLELAAHRGYDTADVREALTRSAELLALSQQEDGTWGHEAAMEHRALIGWRALRRTTRTGEAGESERPAGG